MRHWLIGFSLLSLVACAAAPKLDTGGVQTGLTPTAVVHSPETTRGQRVMWGGMILSGRNHADNSELEVLAYPLGGDQLPRTERKPLGRFIARFNGYLELAEYSPGRRITLVGPVREVRRGKLGESEYTYPVLETEQHELWPDPTPARARDNTRFHFGIGVIFN